MSTKFAIRRKFHYVHQRDAMQCGVACLAMACADAGHSISTLALEEICQPTPHGVSLKAMADAAREIGLEALPAKVSEEYLSAQQDYLVILHWNQNHYVYLRKVSKRGNRFLIADPAKGLRWYKRDEFLKHWLGDNRNENAPKGVALLLRPTKEFAEKATLRSRTKHKNFAYTLLGESLKPYKRQLAIIIVTLLVGSLLQLIFPFLTQAIVDKGIGSKNISLIWLILLGEMMIVTGRTITDFIRRKLLLHVSLHLNIKLLTVFFKKLLRLPMRFFDTKLLGDMMQRMGDHKRIQSFLTDQALSIMFAALSFIVFGVVLLLYSRIVFCIFILGSAVYVGWVAIFLRHRRVLDYELFEAQAINQNRTYQLLTSMPEIKVQGCGERRHAEWEQVQMDLYDIQNRSLILTQKQEGGAIFINELINILIVVVSATSVINGSLTLGGMLAIQFVVGQLSGPVKQIMSFIYVAQDVRISLERIGDIHERDDEDALTQKSPIEPLRGDIVLSNLNFRYDRHNPKLTLSDINLVFPAGKVTAVVGASGSGKSTLLKLMLGFYSPECGEIMIDGCNLETLNKERWRSLCGVVMQEGVIFSDTILRNIAMDDEDLDQERVKQAAMMACLHDEVMKMPLGYHTNIGLDGVGLSVGQRQRILIARAVYRSPQYIFLDEATNSLDTINERLIERGLRDFYSGRTVVVIAHRLSTVRHADNIVVLNEGRVVEQGSHEDLINRRGAYYELVRNQLELPA